jgi:hypothetical protein
MRAISRASRASASGGSPTTDERTSQRLLVPRLHGRHFVQHMRMAADRALAEHDERARQDVGALHRDCDRRLPVRHAEQVRRPGDDALAAEDVHAVVHGAPPGLGELHLEDRAGHARPLALVQRGRGEAPRRIARIELGRHLRDQARNRMEFADRQSELLADLPIAVAHVERRLLHGRAERGQRDGAARGQALHQHAPALAHLLFAADHPVHRHEHLAAMDRAVHEGAVHRAVAPADLHAFVRHRNQRAGDAEFALALGPALVHRMEGQSHDGGDGRERDVALVEVDQEAARAPAAEFALDHDAAVRNGRRVGACVGRGQPETWKLAAVGQARQVAHLLRVGSVAQQQLRGPERVGHHHGHGGGDVDGGDARHHRGMRVVAKAETAKFFGNDHSEEALAAQVPPHLGRQVARLVDGVVVEHAAQLAHLAVDEGLLALAEPVGPHGREQVEVGAPRKKQSFEADGAGLERGAFGVAERR